MKANPSVEYLNVYLGAELVGSVFNTDPLSFEYAETWLARPNPVQIANISQSAGRISSEFVLAFFDNLLPEGALREHIEKQRHVSSTFGLLREVAGDTAGGMVLLPPGQEPGPFGYELITWEKLAAALSGEAGSAFDVKVKNARVSLSGAQDKTLISIDATGSPLLPVGTSPSSHILKPNIRVLKGVWDSAANEAIVMRAAAKCHLPTAEVFYESHTRSCVVARFDRYRDQNGDLNRLIQYDLCQLSGTPSDRKYESDGGPGLLVCRDLIQRYSSTPAVDIRNFLAWIFFNLCVGNNDGHAKNLALYAQREGGVKLAPFYDLMCTRVYAGLSRSYAFKIGGEDVPGDIGRGHVVQLAKDLNVQPRLVLQVAGEVSEAIVPAMKQAVEEIEPDLPPSAKNLAMRVVRTTSDITKGLQKRILQTGPASTVASKEVAVAGAPKAPPIRKSLTRRLS